MSDDKIKRVNFNQCQKLDDEFLHVPLEPSWHNVVIDGHKIPRFLARKTESGAEVLLDGRLIYEFDSVTEARMAVDMAANAMAIGAGYSHLAAKDKSRPFAPTVIGIGSVGDEP